MSAQKRNRVENKTKMIMDMDMDENQMNREKGFTTTK